MEINHFPETWHRGYFVCMYAYTVTNRIFLNALVTENKISKVHCNGLKFPECIPLCIDPLYIVSIGSANGVKYDDGLSDSVSTLFTFYKAEYTMCSEIQIMMFCKITECNSFMVSIQQQIFLLYITTYYEVGLKELDL